MMAQFVRFPEANTVWKGDGKEVGDLPAFVDAQMTVSCVEFTAEELAEIMRTKRIFIGQMNFGRALQPQSVYPTNPFVVLGQGDVPEGKEVN